MDVRSNAQKGQAVVESILLLGLMVFFMNFLFKGLKDMNFAKNLTAGPWSKVTGMIECGVWQPCTVQKAGRPLHPSNRVVSYKPDGQ